jgi:hypothetical protein
MKASCSPVDQLMHVAIHAMETSLTNTTTQCSACSAQNSTQSPFCMECGAYQVVSQLPAVPKIHLPLFKQNPLGMLEKMNAGGAQQCSADDLIAFRYELAEQLEGSELLRAAEAELERALAPKLLERRAGERFFRLWLGFWKRLDEAVRKMREQIAEVATSVDNPPAVVLRLQQAFRDELTQVISTIEERGGDLEALLTLFAQMHAGWIRMNAVWLRVEALRVERNSIAFLDEVRPTNILLARLEGENDGTGFKHVIEELERVGRLYRDANTVFASDQRANDELRKRHAELLSSMEKLVDAGPMFVKDTETWFSGVTKGWPVSDPQDFEVIRSGTVDDVLDLMHGFRKPMDARITQLHQECADMVEGIKQESIGAAERELSRKKQDAFIRELVTTQQALRQQSQGKFGSAWITATFGVEAGSAVEGVARNLAK